MKKSISVVLLITTIMSLMVLFVGCAEVSEGDVYSKEFKPAYMTTIIVPMVISNGETSTTYFIPYIYRYPDRWVISIKKYNEKKQEFDTAEFYVSEEVYDQVNIGDYFIFDEDMGSREEPYTKERQEG